MDVNSGIDTEKAADTDTDEDVEVMFPTENTQAPSLPFPLPE